MVSSPSRDDTKSSRALDALLCISRVILFLHSSPVNLLLPMLPPQRTGLQSLMQVRSQTLPNGTVSFH